MRVLQTAPTIQVLLDDGVVFEFCQGACPDEAGVLRIFDDLEGCRVSSPTCLNIDLAHIHSYLLGYPTL